MCGATDRTTGTDPKKWYPQHFGVCERVACVGGRGPYGVREEGPGCGKSVDCPPGKEEGPDCVDCPCGREEGL